MSTRPSLGLRLWCAALFGMAIAAGCLDQPREPDEVDPPDRFGDLECGPFCGTCGNGICEPGELHTCARDCPLTRPCGNHVCDPNETPLSCPRDCPMTTCGDGICAFSELPTCPADCGPLTVCGDGLCEPPENPATCSVDCP